MGFPLADDVAYYLPMLVFLAFTQVGVSFPSLYPASYVAKTALVTGVLIYCWPHYTKIRWNAWGWGIVFGVIGIVQWVGMERLFPNYPKLFSIDVYDPHEHFHTRVALWMFILVRWAGATLLVPVMEELFCAIFSGVRSWPPAISSWPRLASVLGRRISSSPSSSAPGCISNGSRRSFMGS